MLTGKIKPGCAAKQVLNFDAAEQGGTTIVSNGFFAMNQADILTQDPNLADSIKQSVLRVAFASSRIS